jgi:hypothetical protein
MTTKTSLRRTHYKLNSVQIKRIVEALFGSKRHVRHQKLSNPPFFNPVVPAFRPAFCKILDKEGRRN